MLGTYALSAGYYDAYYGKAQRVRTLIIRDFARAYESFDALLSPTSPTVAFELGAKAADPLAMYLSDVCTIPTNLAGHPAISVPFGTGRDGLPVGVQVLADAVQEPTMFRVAQVLEESRHDRRDAGRVRGGHRARGRTSSWRPPRSCSAGAPTSSAPSPTRNVCPVCLGLPGSLPVLNRAVVEFALRLARPRSSFEVPEQSIFARKNYFYPDMPKDYQISQYEEPISSTARSRSTARASASSARTSRRTPARPCTSAAAVASTRPTTRSSTTTAPACR